MKTYLLEHNGHICEPRSHKNYNVICIEEEVAKYNLSDSACNCLGLDEEVFQYKLWSEAYLDNNINGFSLPITVNTNEEYRKILEKKLLEYVECLNRPAFAYDKKTLEFN